MPVTSGNTSTIVAITLLLFLLASGCGRQPLHLNISEAVVRPPASVVIFFPDGLDVRRMDALLIEGKLPNIEKRFVRSGVRVEHAVSCLPALTYPNTVSLMTGVFPGHHGITGNQWFDRRNMNWVNYISALSYLHVNRDFLVPTLYERIPDHFTFNIQCHTQRGVTYTMNNPIETGIAWLFGWYVEVDQFVGASIEQIGPAADRAGRWPSVITFYFPGLDAVGHENGSDSAAYHCAIINIDQQVGRITDAMDRAGLLADAHLVLVSDHGHVDTRSLQRCDLLEWLGEQRDMRCHIGDIPYSGYLRRADFLDRYDLMAIDGSGRRLQIHVRGERGWAHPPGADEVARVISGQAAGGRGEPVYELPCVEFAAMRDGADRVRVFSRQGQAIIERRFAGSEREYRVIAESGGDDPLGLADTPELRQFIAQGWHASRQWLIHTAHTRYPDFVPQIVEYFESPTAGDIVVFAAKGWVLADAEPGEHGSCLSEDMHIPMFFSGPGLPQGTTIPNARIVDVMPTVLDLLGEAERLRSAPRIDGESLLPQLRAADESRRFHDSALDTPHSALRTPRSAVRAGTTADHE